MSKRKAREEALFSTLQKSIQTSELKNRLGYLLEWYDAKAQFNRRWYHGLRIASVLLPGIAAALSLFSFLGGGKVIAAITGVISLATAFLAHLLDQFRFYESWMRYRNAAEALKREAFLCLSGCEPYSGDQPARERLLAARVEEIACKETAGWVKLRTQQQEENDP